MWWQFWLAGSLSLLTLPNYKMHLNRENTHATTLPPCSHMHTGRSTASSADSVQVVLNGTGEILEEAGKEPKSPRSIPSLKESRDGGPKGQKGMSLLPGRASQRKCSRDITSASKI